MVQIETFDNLFKELLPFVFSLLLVQWRGGSWRCMSESGPGQWADSDDTWVDMNKNPTENQTIR